MNISIYKTLVLAATLFCADLSTAFAHTSPSVNPPTGSTLMFKAIGNGVQIYTCTDSHWTLKAPEARLLNDQGKVIGKHFAGPTWKLDNGGEVTGKAIATQPSPDPASVPWLLLEAVSTNHGSLSNVTYIRRVDTTGGMAPKDTCTGGELRVPYTATYEFYSSALPSTPTSTDK